MVTPALRMMSNLSNWRSGVWTARCSVQNSMADSGDENGTLGDEREGHTEDFGGGGGAARAAQTGDNNPRIFVGNLTQPSSKEAVQALFGQYGGIARVDFKQNFAFVVFDEPESARKAVDTLHDFQQDCGKVLKVEMAVDREKKDRKKDRADNMMTERPMNRGPVVRLENRVVITGKNGEFPEGKHRTSYAIQTPLSLSLALASNVLTLASLYLPLQI